MRKRKGSPGEAWATDWAEGGKAQIQTDAKSEATACPVSASCSGAHAASVAPPGGHCCGDRPDRPRFVILDAV